MIKRSWVQCLLGTIFWLKLFCSFSCKPFLATLLTSYNLGKTRFSKFQFGGSYVKIGKLALETHIVTRSSFRQTRNSYQNCVAPCLNTPTYLQTYRHHSDQISRSALRGDATKKYQFCSPFHEHLSLIEIDKYIKTYLFVSFRWIFWFQSQQVLCCSS